MRGEIKLYHYPFDLHGEGGRDEVYSFDGVTRAAPIGGCKPSSAPAVAYTSATTDHRHAHSCLQLGSSGQPAPAQPDTGKVPTARTDKEAMEATLAELRRYNVVRAVAGGRPEHVARWRAADPERIIGGTTPTTRTCKRR